MPTLRRLPLLTLALAVGLAAPAVQAQTNGNIDVSTIPPRDSVQLTIYNSEDLTLVRETRTLTFARGDNPLQFSWANTLIDPSSVDIRFITHADRLDVTDTTFPHDRPQVLVWNVGSRLEGEAVVEITYFTSGITWAADYLITADRDEANLRFEGFVRVTNNSGESYDDASIRLVVGEINLVEQIAELARRGMVSMQVLEDVRNRGRDRWEQESAGVVGSELRRMAGAAASAPREIVKEGLSEYFIFTVEGTQDVPNQWSRRLPLFDGADVPATVVYRYRPQEYGNQLVRLYTLRNDQASHLGESPLPDGVVRVYRQNPHDGLTFLTAFGVDYIPIGQVIDVNLGADPKVVYTRVPLRYWRDEVWLQDTGARKLIGPDDLRRNLEDFPVVGWNQNERWVERIRNGHDRPIDVELRHAFSGDVTLSEGPAGVTRHDYQTAQFVTTIPGGTRQDLEYVLTYRMGTNAQQNRLRLPGGGDQ